MNTVPTLLLDVRTTSRRYLVPRTHLDHLELITANTLPPPDAQGRPMICRELGPLLDPHDVGLPGRRHALTVVLRRRTVALLVERAEDLDATGSVQPLGSLVARRLTQPWVLGAVVIDETPIIVLDLRRIATDIALGAVETPR